MKIRLSSWIIFFLFSIVSCTSKSEEISSFEARCNAKIDQFFSKIENKQFDSALKELLESNQNIDISDSATISLLEKFRNINLASGEYISRKILRKRELNSDLGIYTYLVKYEKKFYRFVFVFYNNDKEIKLYKFSFDDVIDIEMEESIKLYAK